MPCAAWRVVLRGFDGREKWQKLNECLTRKRSSAPIAVVAPLNKPRRRPRVRSRIRNHTIANCKNHMLHERDPLIGNVSRDSSH